MQYVSHYSSPLGPILLAADDIGLTGLWFEGQKYFALHLDPEREERELPLFETAKRWLDLYFSGKEPDFSVPLPFTNMPGHSMLAVRGQGVTVPSSYSIGKEESPYGSECEEFCGGKSERAYGRVFLLPDGQGCRPALAGRSGD